MPTTVVLVRETPTSIERVMNVITPTSAFRNSPAKNLHTLAGQAATARDIVNGWMQNGAWADPKFTILQTESNIHGWDGGLSEDWRTRYDWEQIPNFAVTS